MSDPRNPNQPPVPPRQQQPPQQQQRQPSATSQSPRGNVPATQQPMPQGGDKKELEIPSSRQEFKYEGKPDGLPGWVDKGWSGYDRGPALHVPQGPALRTDGPYTTKTARPGDTIVFVPNEGATPAHYEVLHGEVTVEEGGTPKPPQQSQASLEDMVLTGVIAPDELGEDAKAQVAARSPSMQKVIDGTMPAPKAQKVAVKI